MKRISFIVLMSSIFLSAALADPVVPATHPSATQTAGLIAPRLQHFVDDKVLAGAVVLVADKDRILAYETLGYSDIAASRAMEQDTVFWIASMTKTFTAAAFMMLVDEGKVSLDDPVAKYIPGFANLKVQQPDKSLADLDHPILIREILSHTAGLRFLNSKDAPKIDNVPLATSIEHVLAEPLIHQPGSKYQYSNEGIDAAGRIIEIVSGVPYEKFLQDRLFTPLGMTDTTFWPNADQMRRLAKCYQSSPDKQTLIEKQTPHMTYPFDGANRYAAPGGGLFSTARDVARFCQMLAAGGTLEGRKYLSKESVRMMATKQTPSHIKDQYGLGAGVAGDKGASFGHGGALKTSMWIENGMVRVFLVQHMGEWASGNPKSEFDAQSRQVFPTPQTASEAPSSTVGTQPPAR